MKEKELYSQSWCNILFAHRNKAYGAYQLRAQTGRRYGWAIGGMLLIVLLISAPFIVYSIMNRPYKGHFPDTVKKMARFEGVQLKEARPVRRPPQNQKPSLDAEQTPVKALNSKDNVATVSHLEDGIVDAQKIEDVSPDSIELLQKEKQLDLAKNTEQTRGIVLDSIPRYPGGIAAFMRWLNKYMVYPTTCRAGKESGKVVVAFIVEPTGKVTDIRVLEGDNWDFNHEVVRVLRRMGKWIPGHRNGKPIRTQVTLPVEFEYNDTEYS